MNKTLTILITLISFATFGQNETKPVKITKGNETEIFYVLKDKPSIRQGEYSKLNGTHLLCSGHYNDNNKSGIWKYYNDYDDLIYLSYDFDNKMTLVDSFNYCFKDKTIYRDVQPPTFFNRTDFYKKLYSKIKYPEFAKEYGYSGQVIVSVTIDSFGKPTKYEIIKSVHAVLDDETLRVLKIVVPELDWVPGNLNGVNVESVFCFRVDYKLN